MVETPEIGHDQVQGVSPRVAEWGMSQIVGQGHGFGQIFLQAQLPGHGTGDLRHFQGMGQAAAVVITFVMHENLGFVLQTAERRTMDDAIAIPLECRPRGVRRLVIKPAPALCGTAGKDGPGHGRKLVQI